jgi:K+-transporting ATPase ATPase A chain
MLYAFSQAVANNGSAFGGLTANPTSGAFAGDWHWNVYLGMAILLGRWLLIVPVMALAGTLAMKKPVATSKAGSFPVTGPTFVILLISVILIMGALSFFPALALGPLVEHFLMHAHQLY